MKISVSWSTRIYIKELLTRPPLNVFWLFLVKYCNLLKFILPVVFQQYEKQSWKKRKTKWLVYNLELNRLLALELTFSKIAAGSLMGRGCGWCHLDIWCCWTDLGWVTSLSCVWNVEHDLIYNIVFTCESLSKLQGTPSYNSFSHLLFEFFMIQSGILC